MPINTNESETRAFIALFHKSQTTLPANAFSRVFAAGQPFREGDRIALCGPIGQSVVVYAGAIVRAVVESTFAARCAETDQSKRWALAEGYASVAQWAAAMRKRTPSVKPNSRVLRVLLNEVRLSPEITGGVSSGEEFDPYATPQATNGKPKTVISAQSLDSFAELGG